MEKQSADGVENLSTDTKSNVIITQSTEIDNTVALQPESQDVFKNISSSVQPTISRPLDDRWLFYGTKAWNSSDQVNKLIFDINLPFDLVKSNINSPNIALFLQHRLWRGNLRIKMLLNSSQFNVGQLIAFWYYGSSYDNNAQFRKNFFSGVQLPHVLISASTSNDVEMVIPFKSFKSYLSTMERPDDSDPLSMGSFCVAVSSQLSVAAGSSTSVDMTIFIACEESEFHGTIDRSFVVSTYEDNVIPQMMPIKSIINTASDVLDTVYPDPNRDKPPVTSQYSQVIPLATGSWASGTNDVDKVYSLRLNPMGQTPHPPGSCNTSDETLFSDIKKRLGFLTELNWKDSYPSGHIIQRIRANPDSPMLFPTVVADKVPMRYLPPCSVLANFNCYWRGDLEFTFDVIANASHKGALAIAYVPGASDETPVSLATLKNSNCAIFKLDGKIRFKYVVPYISDKPWWSVGETFSNYNRIVLPPGMLYICVLNKLSIMNAVTKEIKINVYLSAGDNFEVAVPIPPLYVPTFNAKRLPIDKTNLYPIPGYDATVGFGTWRYVGAHGVLRYSDASDHVTQWMGNMVPYGIYEIDPKSVVKDIYVKYNLSGKVFNGLLKYFVRCIVNGDRDKYCYMTGFIGLNDAVEYIRAWKKTGNNDPLADTPTYKMLSLVEDSTYYTGQLLLTFKGVSHVEPQMEVDAVFNFSQRSATSNDGYVTFGEQFSNVLDYGRRYQPYCSTSITANASNKDDSHKLQCRIPIFPIGLQLVHNVDFSRESLGGIIPLLLAGYRFYRGGLRFRIVVRCDQDVTIFIQHRMDEIADSRQIVKVSGEVSHYDMLESGYAQTFCCSKLNPTLTFEVPFYNNGILALLQEPNFKTIAELQHYSMGYLSISAQAQVATNVNLQVYYSFADDFKPSHFIGFGPLNNVKELVTIMENVKEELLSIRSQEYLLEVEADVYTDRVEDGSACKSKTVKKLMNLLTSLPDDIYVTYDDEYDPHGEEEVEQEDEIESQMMAHPQGFMDKFKQGIVKQAVTEVVENKSSIIEMLQTFIDPFIEKFATVISDIRGKISTVIANLGHVLISNQWKHWLWGIVSIAEVCGIIKSKYIEQFFSTLTGLWEKFTLKYSSLTRDYEVVSGNDKVEAQANTDELSKEEIDSTSACFSTIVSLIVMSMDISVRKINTGQFFTEKKSFADLFHRTVVTSNSLCTFFKNTIAWMFNLYKIVKYKFSKLPQIQYIVAEEHEYVDQWYRDCIDLTTNHTEQEIAATSLLNVKLLYCAHIAEVLQRKFTLDEWKDNASRADYTKFKIMTSAMCKRILSLKHDLTKFAQMSIVRFEPFVISHDGDPGVGKSFITDEISEELLHAVEWRGRGETKIVRTSGNRYWNGLLAQPTCVYDDFLSIQSQDAALQEISELIMLKSSAIFNPPQAAISDKYIRYNPKVVFLNTNYPYAHIDGLCGQEAWRRRRDVMIHIKRVPVYENVSCQKIPREVLDVYGHLTFAFRTSTKEENQLEPYQSILVSDAEGVSTHKTWLNYQEYKDELIKRFKAYDEFENINYQRRLKRELSFRGREDDTLKETIDKYSEFLKLLVDRRVKAEREAIEQLSKEIGTMVYGDQSAEQHALGERVSKMLIQDHNMDDLAAATEGKILTDAEACEILKRGMTKNTISSVMYDHCKNIFNMDASLAKLRKFQEEATFMFFTHTNLRRPQDPAAPQGPESPFLAAIPNKIYSCPHQYLFDNYGQYVFIKDVSNLVEKNSSAIQDWLHGRYGKSIFITLEFAEQLALSDDIEDLQTFVNNGKFVIINVSKCNTSCYFSWSIHPLFTTEQMFWRRSVREGHVRYDDLDISIKMLVDPSDVPLSQRYDPRADKFNKLLYKVSELCSSAFFGACQSIFKIVLQLIGFSVSIFFMGKFLMPTMPPPPDAPMAGVGGKAPQMSMYNDYVPKSHQRKGVSMKPPSSAQMDDTATINYTNLIKRNTFFIQIEKEDKRISMRCVGIKGYMFIMLDHYHDFIVNLHKVFGFDDIKIDLIFDGITLPIAYGDIKFISFNCSALLCGLLPSSIGRQFKDLIKHMPDANIASFGANQGQLIEVDSFNTEIHKLNIKRIDSITISPEVEEAGQTFVDTVWQHNISRKGLCGSVLLSSNNVTKPLIGIHVAGIKNKNVGYCEAVVADTFITAEEMFAQGRYFVYATDEPTMIVGQSVHLSLPSNVEQLGSVGNEMACRPPEKSKLIPSPCFEQFSQTTHAPPILHPKDPRLNEANSFSPLFSACVYHGYVPRPFHNIHFDKAAAEFRNIILATVKPLRSHHTGVCDYNETIVGNPEYEIQGMEMNTSEGYPYTKMRVGNVKDKHWLIDVENLGNKCVLKSFNPLLKDIMDKKQSLRENGIVPVTIFTDCLKDAKLPLDKIFVPGKTRVFSLSPTDFTVQFRQYYLDFMCAYQNARFNADHAIGIDVESLEWNEMVDTLHSNSHCIVVGDYKKFGPTLMKKCVDECFDIMIEWYETFYEVGPKDSDIRRIMGLEISNAYHLMIDNLYKTYCGAPSGSPITTILNSMVNSLYIRTAWNSIMGNISFDKNVKMISYGDDIIMSVKKDIVDKFNCNSLAKFFEKYDIVFTDAKKEKNAQGEFVPYGKITDDSTTFLKNTFVRHPNRKIYISCLDPIATNEIGNWIMKSPTPIDITIDACVMHVRKHFPYGKEKYEKKRKEMIKFWSLQDQKIIIPSWECLDEEMFGQFEFNMFRLNK